MDIFLFGTGVFYDGYKNFFSGHNILALLDNNIENQGKYKDGIKIISPNEVLKFQFEAVFLLSSRDVEMRLQLLSVGVEESKIFSFYQIFSGLKKRCSLSQIHIYGKTDLYCTNRKKIICITPNMEMTGAVIVLLEAVKIIKKNGYEAIVATLNDGPMVGAFTSCGVSVVHDENLKIMSITFAEWIQDISPIMIFINTIFLWHLLRSNNICVPIVWWLHDSEMLYQPYLCYDLDSFSQNSIQVYAVSEVARKPFLNRCLKWQAELLPFGIEDVGIKAPLSLHGNKIVFAIIGSMEKRKAQDVFLDAVQLLSEDNRKQCEFWIIYQHALPPSFAEQIKARASEIEEVKILGKLDRRELHTAMIEMSVLVCPSLSDTLPVVTIEAMQHYRPCIVSDETGTSDFLEDNVSGWICKVNDSQDLADKMTLCIQHSERLPQIGRAARKIYEQYFTLEVFERNLLKLVKS